MTKEKIAFIVVRYGKDINGGAEYHCRMLAERLVNDYDVEVLTTCVKILLNRTYIKAMSGRRLRQRSGGTSCTDVVF